MTVASNPYYAQFVKTITAINAKVKSEDLTKIAHSESLFVNNYQAFGQLASKLGGVFAKPQQYSLNSVQAFYL